MTDGRRQSAEPAVTRAKFDREISEYRAQADEYRRRGWLLLDVDFPRVLVAMAAPQLAPPALVCGVLLDYTNYDAEPPSVRLVNPFTGRPYPEEQLPTRLLRSVSPGPIAVPPGFQLPPGAAMPQVHQPLMQCHQGHLPFLCFAGVREYHEHPAHSGDSWELHRRSGAGRLARLLEVIDTYGVRPIADYGVQLTPQVNGLIQREVPE